MIFAALHSHAPYLAFVILVMTGASMLLAYRSLVRALVGLYLIQCGAILFFILLAALKGGTVPILGSDDLPPLVNPLPHAMMLTAIVVGVATLGVGLALLIRIQHEDGSLEDATDRGDGE